MATSCRICEFRSAAVGPRSSLLHVRIITLTFKVAFTQSTTESHTSLNTLLYNIVDNEDAAPNTSTFTAWSPCRNNPKTVVIVTTIQHVCDNAASSIFNVINEHLANPPEILHAYLGLDAISLAPSSSDQRIACDIYQLRSTQPSTTVSIDEQFCQDNQRSLIRPKLRTEPASSFGYVGNLIKNYRVWAEREPIKPSISSESSSMSSSSQISLDSDKGEQRTSLYVVGGNPQPQDEEEEETFLMIFQWANHTNRECSKDQGQTNYDQNDLVATVSLWEKEVATPLSQLQQGGAIVDIYNLELRAIEPRLRDQNNGERLELPVGLGSRKRRLTNIATDLGEKVSRLWK